MAIEIYKGENHLKSRILLPHKEVDILNEYEHRYKRPHSTKANLY